MPRLFCLATLLLTTAVLAAPPAPPQPAEWDAQIRYQIFAFRGERIKQYRDLLAAFKAAGFERDPSEAVPDDEADNPRSTQMRGTLPARGVSRILAEKSVRALLLSPKGAKLPAKGSRVRADLTIASGYSPEAQRTLHRQTAEALTKGAGFVEAVGYDHRGFSRLLGSAPVENLERLSEYVFIDLRLPPASRDESPIDVARLTAADLAKTLGFIEPSSYPGRNSTRLYGAIPVLGLESVPVDLTLPKARENDIQRALFRRIARGLARAGGFIEADAYDNKGYFRLVGSVPLMSLGRFLDALRDLPGRERMPSLLRTLHPVLVVEARPDLPVPAGRPAAPVVPAGQQKFDPALRALLAGGKTDAPGRLEVILGYTPLPLDRSWIRPLEATGARVEGRMGPLVTVSGVIADVAGKLAGLEDVVAVRLPRVALRAAPGPKGDVPPRWEPMQASGLARLHALGRRGRGTRIAIVSDDFKGWQTLKDRKEGKVLLPDPVLVDLTAERSRDLQPDPYPSADRDVALGHGTRCAATVLKAAPEAELTLIRVDAAAPYMLELAARAINGDRTRSIAIDARFREVDADHRALERRRAALAAERRSLQDRFVEREKEERDIFEQAVKDRLTPEQVEKLPAFRRLQERERDGKVAKGVTARLLYSVRQHVFDLDEAALRGRERRLLRLVDDLLRLKGIRIVASGLVWVDGHPVDGSSALSRYFDDRPFKAALWFQAAGDTRGQAWSGLFGDRDGNGVLEFAGPKARLAPGAWTPELNFLSWQPAAGAAERFIPAGTRLRLTLQWREAHDPLPLRVGEDVYREPLAKFRLVVVRQFDPDGKTRPADDLSVVAQSAGRPQRLNQTPNSATYEIAIDLTVPAAGRYGVFVEGTLPDSIQAPGEASIPATRKVGEVRPRLFVNTLQGNGRAVWADFTTRSAALGMPADARQVVTVGAADASNQPQPSTPTGPPYNLLLLKKPDVLAYDNGGGTDEATCFAAGLVASSWGSQGTLFGALERLCGQPGAVLRVPSAERR
jgi:hypothetical protein